MLDMLISKPPPSGPENRGQRIPSWGEAYVRYRPLLFSALSKLATRGYTTAPDDGMDLMHDFFLEAWPGIAANYDPSKARLETYLYGSFVQFARPRIVRQHRWRDALVSPMSLADLSAPDFHSMPVQPLAHDLTAVRAAVAKLSAFEQGILAAYVSDAKSSERDLAHRFSLTRYQLRSCLADALGKIAVALGEMSAMSRAERAVMVALWGEGRTVKETARVLQVSTSEVQAMRVRLFEMLSAAVKGRVPNKAFAAKANRKAPRNADLVDVLPGAEELLVSAIKSEMREAALRNIQENKNPVFEFLESAQAEPFFAKYRDTFTPENLAQLYAALGCQEHVDPEDAALIESFFEGSEQDEEKIGRAFSEVLIPNLPVELTRFRDRIFHGAELVDPRQHAHVMSQPCVRAGGTAAAELALFGVTPVTIIEATQGVANLARRYCDQSGVKRYDRFIVDKVGKTEGYSMNAVLSRDHSVREVMLVCEIAEPTAARLFDWLTRVTEYAPSLFDGFEAELMGD